MCEKEYVLKFTQFPKYAPSLISNPITRGIKFMFDVIDIEVKEFLTSMLINDMDNFRLMTYCDQI